MSRPLVICIALLLLTIAASACQAPTAPGTPTPAPTPIVAADPQQAAIQQAWQTSKHAASFVAADDGANNICARCHAPHNWLPTNPDDMPETCASCKFTIKTPKPVATTDWRSIPCDVCHRVENGALTSEVAFLNTAISQFETGTDPYEKVASAKQLCERCHTDRGGFYYQVDLGTGAHSSFDCTKCHNPHASTASCTTCHPDARQPAQPRAGHDAAHAAVSCVACHDAAKLTVGPTDGAKSWTTFRATAPGGKLAPSPFASHNLQRAVDCTRCHFAKNPWGLADNVKAQ